MLSWDYYSLRGDEDATHTEALRPLPSTFASFAEYVETFEPLILEECSAQVPFCPNPPRPPPGWPPPSAAGRPLSPRPGAPAAESTRKSPCESPLNAQILRGEEEALREAHLSVVTAFDRVEDFHVARRVLALSQPPLPAAAAAAAPKAGATTRSPQTRPCRFGLEEGNAQLYKDNDLVLISKLPPRDDVAADAPHAHTHAMGVVSHHEGSRSLRLRLFLPLSAVQGPPGRRAASEARFAAMRTELAAVDQARAVGG